METFLTITKNTLIFIALWIFSYVIVDAFTDNWEDFVTLVQALAVATLIAFVWKRIAKKYL